MTTIPTMFPAATDVTISEVIFPARSPSYIAATTRSIGLQSIDCAKALRLHNTSIPENGGRAENTIFAAPDSSSPAQIIVRGGSLSLSHPLKSRPSA